MRLHVVSLPHTQTTRAFDHCAYTAKVRKFCDMMTARGHELLLYAGESNEARVSEHIVAITADEQRELLGGYDWFQSGAIFSLDWSPELDYWRLFNGATIEALRERVEPRDFVCLITGYSASPIVDALGEVQCVEFGIGYEGVHPRTRHVFESYAWMHALYGKQGPSASDGRFYDAVIPNFYDPGEFPGPGVDDGYLLFMSRTIARKGVQIAIEASERAGLPLKIAGVRDSTRWPAHVEHVGLADTRARGRLLANARAVLMPTIYLEPFGGVAAESLLCGTPVISTDWGAFPEYVANGLDGYRCRSLAEFVQATDDVQALDREAIRERAQLRFGYDTIGEMYERNFERLLTLWGDGFYAGCR